MAIPATCVWEVRPTNGTANAGGGFDPAVASPGTDYSQQDAVQIAYTDLVIGGTTTQLSSAANPFTSSHVGNNIAIVSGTGFTVGIYNVRSVAAGIATMDRAVGTAASTGGTGNLGGARSGFSVGTTTLQSSLVAGNKAWVKNEAWNEAVSFTVAASGLLPIVVEGYDTVRDDRPTGTGRPLNNRASAAGDGITNSGADYWMKYLRVTAAGDAGFSCASTALRYVHCASYGNTGEGFEFPSGNGQIFLFCESYSNTGAGIGGAAAGLFYGCYVHDNTAVGILSNGTAFQAILCIVESNSSSGMSQPGNTSYIFNCTINGNTGASSDGVAIDQSRIIFLNNIVSNNGRDGCRANNGNGIQPIGNNFHGNSGAARTNFPVGTDDVALDPQFVDAANGNFAIGTNLRGMGFPGAFPGGLSTGYLDIGAVQRQEPARKPRLGFQLGI